MVNLTFIGLGHGSPDEENQGKRRAVTYLSFLTFVMIVAAMDADDWVTGGVEFDIGGTLGTDISTLPPEILEACGDMSGLNLYSIEESLTSSSSSSEHMLGVTITPMFHLGLKRYTQGGQTLTRYSRAAVDRECSYTLSDELDDINAATKQNNTFWYGLQPFSVSTFDTTFGLLGFAAFLQTAVWIAFVCIAYDAPFVSTYDKTPLAIRILSVGSAFFTMVALIFFGSSTIKSSFCNAFDPDTRFNGTFCGYQTGFNLCITSVVFSLTQTLLVWLWLPATAYSGARYEFSGKGASGGYDNVGGGSSGITDASGMNAPSAVVASGTYQDFGSTTA